MGQNPRSRCCQGRTLVRILDHGVAKVEPYPDYYAAFMDDMLSRNHDPYVPDKIYEPLRNFHECDDENYLYIAPVGPVIEPVLYTQHIDTSLEDANTVGNIYFANYYAWQGPI